jgi:hypothetical protein
VDFPEYARRGNARLAEIAAQQARVASFLLKGPLSTNLTVAAVQAAFQAANATSSRVPAIEKVRGGINITYNLAKWDGNTTAYLECNLPVRGPDYVGRCEALPVTCVSTSNDSVPYTCTKADGTTVPGNISSSTYREQCELPCDRQLDCGALCECYDTCTGTQVGGSLSVAVCGCMYPCVTAGASRRPHVVVLVIAQHSTHTVQLAGVLLQFLLGGGCTQPMLCSSSTVLPFPLSLPVLLHVPCRCAAAMLVMPCMQTPRGMASSSPSRAQPAAQAAPLLSSPTRRQAGGAGCSRPPMTTSKIS